MPALTSFSKEQIIELLMPRIHSAEADLEKLRIALEQISGMDESTDDIEDIAINAISVAKAALASITVS